ncbi:MAG: hypothetical protein R6V83_09715 [Candidatus Thorarchaeota archaeon]
MIRYDQYKRNMNLRDRIPSKLELSNALVSIDVDNNQVSVHPTSDYVLLEIPPDVGRISIYQIAKTAYDLVKNDNRMVAIRGYAFKGIGLSVRIAHKLKQMEKRFLYRMTFDTFDAIEPEKPERHLTSVQIIVMPPE